MQADELVTVLQTLDIDGLVSSPYLRALKTIEPFSRHTSLEIVVDERLRERSLPREDAGHLIPHDIYYSWIEHSWKDFNYAPPGGETFLDCQQRMLAVINDYRQKAAHQNLLLCSHGNAISLVLHHLDSDFSLENWRNMPNPELYEIHCDGESFYWNKLFIYH